MKKYLGPAARKMSRLEKSRLLKIASRAITKIILGKLNLKPIPPELWNKEAFNTKPRQKPRRHKQPPRSRRAPALKAVQRRPLKRVSRKMAKLKAYYYAQRNEFLAENTVCQVHGGRCIATECHHTRGRLRTLLIDARFWQAVCPAGHAWIHDQVADARADGHLCQPSQWNHPPDDVETCRLRAIIKEITR